MSARLVRRAISVDVVDQDGDRAMFGVTIHRGRPTIQVYNADDETVYLTPVELREMADALEEASESA